MRSTTPNRRAIASFALAAYLGLLCLFVANCKSLVPRESWSRKWGPMVPHDTFPGDCGLCHYPENWNLMRETFVFDHEKETGVALEGAHARAACLRCHNDRGPVEIYVERGCGGCHVDPHLGALGQECTICHNQNTWDPLRLIADHASTRFPLYGSHALLPCESCHPRASAGYFSGAPADCAVCHQRSALTAVPNHVANGWIVDCEDCHIPLDWRNRGFNHNDFFPLLGGHANLDCTQCHPGGVFAGLDPACFSCHQNDYINAPNHVANNFDTDCTLCHDIFAWN